MDGISSLIGPIFGKLISIATSKRHKLHIDVTVDTIKGNVLETLLRLKNTGDYFESNVKLRIETAVSKDDSVRLYTVQSELNPQVAIEHKSVRSETDRFNTHDIDVSIDGLDKKDEILVRLLSNYYIPTIRARAVSTHTATTYDSRHKEPRITKRPEIL